jgi:hypothetical protein
VLAKVLSSAVLGIDAYRVDLFGAFPAIIQCFFLP